MGKCDALFDDEMDESVRKSPGTVSNDAAEFDDSLPVHLDTAKCRVSEMNFCAVDKDPPQEPINRRSVGGFRNRRRRESKENDMPRGRIAGVRMGFRMGSEPEVAHKRGVTRRNGVITPLPPYQDIETKGGRF